MRRRLDLAVQEIVEDYKSGKESAVSLAARYGVSGHAIYNCLRRNNVKIRNYSEAQILAEKNGRFSSEIKEKQRQSKIKYHQEHSQKREKNPSWKGGRFKDSKGYIMILMPEHPNAVGGYIREHRFIMEGILGRLLKSNEGVHHKNQIRSDNHPNNLLLIEHTNHYGKIKCPYCNKEFLIK